MTAVDPAMLDRLLAGGPGDPALRPYGALPLPGVLCGIKSEARSQPYRSSEPRAAEGSGAQSRCRLPDNRPVNPRTGAFAHPSHTVTWIKQSRLAATKKRGAMLHLRAVAREIASHLRPPHHAVGVQRLRLLVGPLAAAGAVVLVARTSPVTTALTVAKPETWISCVGAGQSRDQLYIGRLYRTLLRRLPDPAGCAYWVTALESPGVTGAQIALGIIGTPEFTVAQVRFLYSTYLHRVADQSGADSAVGYVSAGMSYDTLRATLLGSDEYYGDHGATVAGFIRGLYQDVLGQVRSPNVDGACSAHGPVDGHPGTNPRSPSPSELRYWASQLGTDPSPSLRTHVAGLILGSTEAKQRLVTEWYHWFLSRVPCGFERDYYVGVLVGHQASDQEAMASILEAA